jgi:multidrug transporter EmrE-like cation transporter
MINWRTIGFGAAFGLLDSIALPTIKRVHNGLNPAWMAVPVLLYAASPFLFLKALEKETLTIMNLVWDLSSDLIVTCIGLFIFAESISPLKALGVGFSLIGLFLMSYEGNGWNEYLANKYKGVRDFFTSS